MEAHFLVDALAVGGFAVAAAGVAAQDGSELIFVDAHRAQPHEVQAAAHPHAGLVGIGRIDGSAGHQGVGRGEVGQEVTKPADTVVGPRQPEGAHPARAAQRSRG